MFFGFSTDKKYIDYVVFGVLKSERNENIDLISVDEDSSKNIIQDKFKFDKKFLSKEESAQIKKLSKWLNNEIKGFFIVFKMFNKKLFENEIQTSSNKEINIKENNKELKKSHKAKQKKETESYDNISKGTWFKIVELPWIFILLSFFEFCGASFTENPTDSDFYISLGFSLVGFTIGLIGVLATIGTKKKIREAQGLRITINPYSWFISKIGKVLCGTIFFCIGFGLIFLVSTFINTVFSAGSSSSSSSRTSSSSSHTVHSGSSTLSSSYSSSSSNTHSSSSSISYYCKYCGAKYSLLSSLTSGRCPKHPDGFSKGYHSPYQGNEKTNYYCEYCGAKYSLLSSLTSGRCPKHPDGFSKGYHSPSL